MTKAEFCKKVKEDALMKLASVVGHPVDDSTNGVHDALEEAVRRFGAKHVATATMIVGSWNWATHEIAACEAVGNGGAAAK